MDGGRRANSPHRGRELEILFQRRYLVAEPMCCFVLHAAVTALKDFSEKKPIQTVTLELQQVKFGKRDIRFNLEPTRYGPTT